MKRSRMSRGKPLARGGPLRRLVPLRFRSKETEKVYRQVRRPLVRAMLEEFPICQVPWCDKKSRDLHEVVRRSQGGSITDRDNIRVVCRVHNQVFAQPPQWAYDLGFVRKRTAEDGAS